MPKPSENLGVIPPDEDPETYDKLRRRLLWMMPSGLYLLGARDGDRRNAMTLNFATQVSSDPKLVGVGVWKEAFTHELITQGKVFSLCVIPREEKAVVRKFVKPVEVDITAQTLNGFEYFEATTGAPILKLSVGYLECRVTQAVDAGNHTFFIGEVVNAAFLGQEDAPVLRMEDTAMNYGG